MRASGREVGIGIHGGSRLRSFPDVPMRLLALIVIGAVTGILVGRGCERSAIEQSGDDATHAPPPVAESPRVAVVSAPRPVRQRDLPATDQRYDPVRMSREEGDAVTAREIFEQEPRDERMAPIFENRIRANATRILHELGIADKVQAVHVECKTLSCETRIEAAKEHVTEVYDLVNGIMLGDVQAPGIQADADGTFVVIVNLLRPEQRDDAYYARFLSDATGPALKLVKQQLRGSGDAAPR